MRKTTRNELDKYLKIKQEPREHREEAQQVRSETRLRFAVIEMKLVSLFFGILRRLLMRGDGRWFCLGAVLFVFISDLKLP